MIFDTHIHLNDEKLINDLDVLLKEASFSGVKYFLCVGYDVESSKKAVEIANKYENVYAAVGIIPTEHKQYNKNTINEIEQIALSSDKVIAIGEIGLDYYWENEPSIKEVQKEMFNKQIELANKLDLPISIHSRESYQDTYDILKVNPCKNKGIMHCYGGSLELGKEFIKLGYCLAFGGTLTFKNALKNKEVFKNIPIESIVFETDAPYLSPVPYRGKLNKPEYIKETVVYGAHLLNINLNQMEEISFNNSLRILKLDGKIKIE